MSVRDNECTQGVEDIENSEIRKIAEDILGTAKYSFSTVAADSDQNFEPNSLELDFKEVLKTFKEEELAVIKANAQALVDIPEVGRKMIFGRVGALDKNAFVATGGFEKVSELLDAKSPLKIDTKLLGVKANVLKVPVNIVKPVVEGLLIPTAALPRRVSTEFESVQEERMQHFESASESDIFDETKLSDIWGINHAEIHTDDADIDEFEEQALSSRLSLYIKRVKCVDETNPECCGHDEIALAGVAVDEDGDTNKLSERYIGGGFDDGDSKVYNPHWRYSVFSILEGGNVWPKRYTVTYLLAEKDHGGLSKALNRLWSQIRSKVHQAIAQGLGALPIPGIISKVIAQVVNWVIDKLIGWIVSGLQDDIFRPKFAICTIWGRNQRFYHGRYGDCDDYRNYSKTYTSHFYGHGGHYLIDYYWKLT